MFHVNAIIINHTKHTAIKNSETMLISQFRDQNPAFYQNVINSIRLYSLPSMEGEGQHMVWLRAPLFDVCLTGEVLVTLHRKLRCTRRLLDTMERNTRLQDNTSIHLVTPRFTISRLTSVTLKCTLRTSTKLLIILKRECAYNKFSNLRRKFSIYGVFGCVAFTIAKLKIQNCYYNATTSMKTLKKELFLTLNTCPSNRSSMDLTGVLPFLHWSGRCEHRECLPHCAPPPGPVTSVPGSAPPTHWQPQN